MARDATMNDGTKTRSELVREPVAWVSVNSTAAVTFDRTWALFQRSKSGDASMTQRAPSTGQFTVARNTPWSSSSKVWIDSGSGRSRPRDSTRASFRTGFWVLHAPTRDSWEGTKSWQGQNHGVSVSAGIEMILSGMILSPWIQCDRCWGKGGGTNGGQPAGVLNLGEKPDELPWLIVSGAL
jgi:hypothetical protein